MSINCMFGKGNDTLFRTHNQTGQIVGNSTTIHFDLPLLVDGGGAPITAETAFIRLGVNGIVKKIFFTLSANGLDGNSAISLIRTDGSVLGTVTFATTETGYKETTGLNALINDTDLLNIKIVTGGSASSIKIHDVGILMEVLNEV